MSKLYPISLFYLNFNHSRLCLAIAINNLKWVKMKILMFNPLHAKLFNLNFTHLKLCLADAIHNFKCLKITQIWQNGGQLFLNIAD